MTFRRKSRRNRVLRKSRESKKKRVPLTVRKNLGGFEKEGFRQNIYLRPKERPIQVSSRGGGGGRGKLEVGSRRAWVEGPTKRTSRSEREAGGKGGKIRPEET